MLIYAISNAKKNEKIRRNFHFVILFRNLKAFLNQNEKNDYGKKTNP